MKKQFFSFILILGVTSSAYAQQTCPLTNAKLTDLRQAASKLAKTITMSAECQSYQNTVNQANKDLQGIANQIKAAEEKRAAEAAAAAGTAVVAPDATQPDKAQLAIAAVSQLDTLNSVFKDPKCGQQLAGFLDYADAFIDVVNGMTPFLALYGGSEAAPWVLGPAIGGAAVKALISFFKNKAVNMRNPDQSNAFIKNSCAFYNLNLIKNSLDEVQLNQTPRIETEKRKAESDLKAMVRNAPSKPNNALAKELSLAEKDQARIKSLQDQMKTDATEGCSYLIAYVTESDKTNADGSMLERVWRNYESNVEAGFKLDLEKKYFQQDLNQAIGADNTKCASLGSKWINKMISFNETGLTALKKAADEDGQVKSYRGFLAEKEKQELLIKAYEGRLKFFQEMTNQGFSIEYSEIIRSHRLVQDTLFETNKFIKVVDMGGIAYAWLKVKKEDAESNLSDFEYRRDEVKERIGDIQKDLGLNDPLLISRDMIANYVIDYRNKNNKAPARITKSVLVDVCNQLRTTWASWYSALIHARAGRDYCVTFDNVINKLDYRRVQKSCFGEDKDSLRSKVYEIQGRKAEADEIITYMDQYGCRRGTDATAELIALPVNPT